MDQPGTGKGKNAKNLKAFVKKHKALVAASGGAILVAIIYARHVAANSAAADTSTGDSAGGDVSALPDYSSGGTGSYGSGGGDDSSGGGYYTSPVDPGLMTAINGLTVAVGGLNDGISTGGENGDGSGIDDGSGDIGPVDDGSDGGGVQSPAGGTFNGNPIKKKVPPKPKKPVTTIKKIVTNPAGKNNTTIKKVKKTVKPSGTIVKQVTKNPPGKNNTTVKTTTTKKVAAPPPKKAPAPIHKKK